MHYPVKRLWDMVQEIDEYIGHNDDATDWELSFIADMMDKVRDKESFSYNQKEHVIRVWEKYCA